MLEYLFFQRQYADLFIARLQELNLNHEESQDSITDAILLVLSEEEVEPVWDELDDYYDEFSEKDQDEAEQEGGDFHASGIYLQLAGGGQTLARVDPEVMGRILSVISTEELNSLLEAIVSSVENPDDAPICAGARSAGDSGFD